MTPVPIGLASPKDAYEQLDQPTMPFGEYLFRRLAQVQNVQSVFGVPGDFNLPLLEHIYKTNLNWIGGCNELNSGYTADGYSRYTKSLGVLITTYGVGELSAINAVAGAFAESSKILHIVGIPSLKTINSRSEKKKHLHHLVPSLDPLADSDHLVYTKMVSGISCISKVSLDPSQAVNDLDEVIEEIFNKSKPGYFFLPVDMSEYQVDCSRLDTSPSNFHILEDSNPNLTEALSGEILQKIYASQNPSLLVDILTDRYYGATEMVRNLVDKTQFSNYTTFMGKSVLDESESSFVGDYNGKESNIGIKENIESSDLVLYIGPHINEINTGHYSFDFSEEQLVILHSEYIKIGSNLYRGVNFVHVLRSILSRLDVLRCPAPKPLTYAVKFRYPKLPSTMEISQSMILEKLQDFMRPNDVMVCETGSLMFGIPDLRFSKNFRYIAQGFYLSIGAALPMSVGIGIAMKDEGSSARLILFEGDGSAQMTFQEFSAFAHYDLKPIIFLLNNSGYTVERIIKGEKRGYNDIKPWNWSKTFEVFEFGNVKTKTVSKVLSNEGELNKGLAGIDRTKLNFFEVILDPMDCPWRFHHMNDYRHFPLNR